MKMRGHHGLGTGTATGTVRREGTGFGVWSVALRACFLGPDPKTVCTHTAHWGEGAGPPSTQWICTLLSFFAAFLPVCLPVCVERETEASSRNAEWYAVPVFMLIFSPCPFLAPQQVPHEALRSTFKGIDRIGRAKMQRAERLVWWSQKATSSTHTLHRDDQPTLHLPPSDWLGFARRASWRWGWVGGQREILGQLEQEVQKQKETDGEEGKGEGGKPSSLLFRVSLVRPRRSAFFCPVRGFWSSCPFFFLSDEKSCLLEGGFVRSFPFLSFHF